MLLLLQSALLGLRYGAGGIDFTSGTNVYGVQNPALGPAWTFTDSAVTDGPVGQWVCTVTGLIRDFGGHGLCGTEAALSGLLVIPGLDVWPEQPLGPCGVGATGDWGP